MIGYKSCRECGEEWNCADLVGGLCPICAKSRIARLAELQGQYESALRDGDPAASEEVAAIIRAYQQSEGVRLKDVSPAFRVK